MVRDVVVTLVSRTFREYREPGVRAAPRVSTKPTLVVGIEHSRCGVCVLHACRLRSALGLTRVSIQLVTRHRIRAVAGAALQVIDCITLQWSE